MRRRRRTKYTWFPQLGTLGGDPSTSTTNIELVYDVFANGDPGDVTIFPIIPDSAQEAPPADTAQLQDFLTLEYILKRIVGKLHLYVQPRTLLDTASTISSTVLLVGAGFFVAREGDQQTGTAFPIGATTAAERRLNYGPLALETTREPWIWRRTWMLGIPYFGTLSGGTSKVTDQLAEGATLPPHNYSGSVADGPHIDAKVARRVGQDDRLYFAIQGQAIEVVGTGTAASATFKGVLDVRMLGATRKPKQRSAF